MEIKICCKCKFGSNGSSTCHEVVSALDDTTYLDAVFKNSEFDYTKDHLSDYCFAPDTEEDCNQFILVD